MSVTRGYYRRWYGLASEIGTITWPLRVTDLYFCTDTGDIYWWTGTEWLEWGSAPS